MVMYITPASGEFIVSFTVHRCSCCPYLCYSMYVKWLPHSQTICLLIMVLCNMGSGLESVERSTPIESCVSFSQESFTKDYPTRQLVAAVEKDVKDEYIWQLRAQCRADQLSQSFNRRKGTGTHMQF